MNKERNFENLVIKPIAHIRTAFPTKFGIPRQNGLAKDLKGTIIFEKEYQKEGFLRGLEEFSHIYLIWGFSLEKENNYSPTIRPPKLGGNKRVSVFASRSPNRPNPLGLSVVEITSIEDNKEYGKIINVRGIDMVDNTPIYDIKPYIPYADSYPNATFSYASDKTKINYDVIIDEKFLSKIDNELKNELIEILSQDPRPGYQNDPNRIYGFRFSSYEIKFKVKDKTVEVIDIINIK